MKKKRAAARMHFTARRIEALPVPEKRKIIHDLKLWELSLKLEPSGAKIFFWFRAVPEEEQPGAAGKPTKKTIGPWPEVTLDAARAKAAEYSVLLANWKKDGCKRPSPFKEHRAELTLAALAEDYFARHLRSHALRPERAEKETRANIKRYLAEWEGRKLSTINRKDVLDLQAKLGKGNGAYTANVVLELVNRLYNFAINQELWVGVNPAAGIKRFHEEKRSRFLQPAEVPLLFAALKKEPNRDLVDFVNLSLWTGARKSDVLSMRWQDISLADNRWTVPDPKNRTPYSVALTPEAAGILKKRQNPSPWVFPAASQSGHRVDLKKRWKLLVERAGLKNLRQHDLRRTLASWQAAQGASLQVIGKSLGHKSMQATQIYSRLNLDTVREAVTSATQAIIAAGRKKPPLLPR